MLVRFTLTGDRSLDDSRIRLPDAPADVPPPHSMSLVGRTVLGQAGTPHLYEAVMDWAYMLLERFVTQGIRAARDRSYPEANRLEVLRSALDSGSDVRMVYFSASSRRFTERVVTPLRLSQAREGQWLLRGFDHLRGEERTFRVGRMKEVGVEPPSPAFRQ